MKNEIKEKYISKGHTKGGNQLYWFTEKEFDLIIHDHNADKIEKLTKFSDDAIRQADDFLEGGMTVSEYCSRAMAAAYKIAIDLLKPTT